MRTFFLGCLLLLLCTPHLQARPIIVRLDVEQADALPAQIGYQLTASREAEKTHFIVDLDARASAAFDSAVLFYKHPGQPPPEIHVTVTHLPGNKSLKRIAFTVPAAALAAWDLQVRSNPLRSQDGPNNFSAYRFRLDNIPPPQPN